MTTPLHHPQMSPHTGKKTHRHAMRRVRIGQREIITENIRLVVFNDLFHYFMTVSWPRLFATFAAFFLAFDAIFALDRKSVV